METMINKDFQSEFAIDMIRQSYSSAFYDIQAPDGVVTMRGGCGTQQGGPNASDIFIKRVNEVFQFYWFLNTRNI